MKSQSGLRPGATAAAACLLALAGAASAGNASFEPVKDNTLYEHPAGAISNGAGPYVFAGRNNTPGNIRRAVMAFDPLGGFTPVPQGAIIEAVTLVIHVSQQSSPDPVSLSLHRLTSDWGEGASSADPGGSGAPAQPGDATWLHTFYDTEFWSTPGGDFLPAPSASIDVDGPETYAIGSTPQMVADVQAWVDNPSTNFGWILLGDESALGTALRIDSRENPNPFFVPKLTVEYFIPAPGAAAVLLAAGAAPAAWRRRRD